MLVFSILVGLALFATSITNDATFGDPALYRYLQVSLGLPGTVRGQSFCTPKGCIAW